MQLPVTHNITLARVPGPGLWIDRGAEQEAAERRQQQLDIRTPSLHRAVEALSGGTQQKVVVARWLEIDARVLFFDEPTRGIDVGAKSEIFKLIGELAAAGKAIVLISSYLPELTNMCDRIVVMRDGRTVGEMPARTSTRSASWSWRRASTRRPHEHQRQRSAPKHGRPAHL